jgi:hypothetical protein
MIRSISLWIMCAIFAFVVFLPKQGWAGVTVVQALSFGEFIVKNNNAQYDIVVNVGGGHTYDSSGFIQISAPQVGIFDIDGLPANSVISSVVITQVSPLLGGGRVFQMVDFQESHTNTNSSGVSRITVGATARTSGSGLAYVDQTYSGDLEIQINF